MYNLLTYGEILLRYTPQNGTRFLNTTGFDCYVGGAELNVAAGVSQLGLKTGIITKIPTNAIGMMARHKVLSCKVSDEYIYPDYNADARIGSYFYEKGSSPRKPEVVYDRNNSSFLKLQPQELPEEIYNNTKCFHTSGINPALGRNTSEQTMLMLKTFKEHGALVSFDVNFRGNLWTGEAAKEYIEKILPYVDIFFCTEDTAKLTFLKTGKLETIMKEFAEEYGISYICTSRRIVHSTINHSFTSLLYNAGTDTYYEEKPYENINVTDRIGSGDAYVAGTLYGILNNLDMQQVVSYGNAMGVIKNTITGDIAEITKDEIDALISSHHSGNTAEMKR